MKLLYVKIYIQPTESLPNITMYAISTIPFTFAYLYELFLADLKSRLFPLGVGADTWCSY